MPRTLGVLVACALACGACGETPTQPSVRPPSPRDPTSILRRPGCDVNGTNVHCTVMLWESGQGERDVTSTATWLVSGTPLSFTPTAIASVTAPGVITPRSRGDISIFVEYSSGGRTVAPYAFAVGPDRQALRVAPYLSGLVRDATAPGSGVGGAGGIGGATVEILDGPDAGKSDTTRDNGYYFIHHVRMGVAFTVRISKAGFVTAVKAHPGIVDDNSGFQPLAILHVDLTPAP